jgi:isoquinoline 1-oxidoreductase beta subunit
VPRIDIPEKVDGSATYSMDVKVPNMLYATILRSPVNGNKPINFNEKEIRSMTGIQETVILKHGVAILGKHYEDLLLAKRNLKVNWSQGSTAEMFNSEKVFEEYRRVAGSQKNRSHVLTQKGDTVSVLKKAERTYSADFLSDHVYHAQMEPLNAVVAVNSAGDGAEIGQAHNLQRVPLKKWQNCLKQAPQILNLTPVCLEEDLGGGQCPTSL